MLRSMYSGISGMRVNQTKLDVTGNNIANVGTTGFKSSRVRFQDMLSQNVTEALGPNRNTGGVNARQVGLGVQVAGIDTVVSQGMMQPTSRNLDVAVDGTGYFVVAKGPLPTTNAGAISVDETEHTMSGGDLEISYTRDGAFTLDYQGNLLTSDGYRVMGYALKEKSGQNADSLSIDYDANGYVNFVDSDSKYGLITTGTLVPLRIPDSVHLNPFSMSSTDGETYDMEFMGNGSTTVAGYAPAKIAAASDFTSKIPVDLNIEYKYDSATSAWITYVNGVDITKLESGDTVVNGFDFLGVTAGPPDTFTNGILDLNLDGTDDVSITAPTGIPAGEEAAYSYKFTIAAEKDKKIRSFSIEKDGVVKAVLDDGSVSALGQLGMASFKNPEGLKKLGKNLYQNTSNSGEPIVRSGINAPKENDNSDGYGEFLQGMLEMSNVDLAEQFTDMIVTTRAFQAAGKMITTGDEILQDIINLKR